MSVDGAFASANEGYQLAYESFADHPGLSDSAAKWDALGLTDLTGRRVLDIGCNAGYFCARALDAGAVAAFGFDASAEVIDEARRRTPRAEFAVWDWDEPWEGAVPAHGSYDVALLLSTLHYSQSPRTLVGRIHDALAPGGVLVFEGGVAEGEEAERVPVVRAHDRTWHFTHRGLEHLFAGWERLSVSPSVAQETDPVPRFVYHLRRG